MTYCGASRPDDWAVADMLALPNSLPRDERVYSQSRCTKEKLRLQRESRASTASAHGNVGVLANIKSPDRFSQTPPNSKSLPIPASGCRRRLSTGKGARNRSQNYLRPEQFRHCNTSIAPGDKDATPKNLHGVTLQVPQQQQRLRSALDYRRTACSLCAPNA